MRILTLTGLYPDVGRPLHGIFIKNLLDALAARTGWEFPVIAPRPVAAPLLGRLLPPPLPPERLPDPVGGDGAGRSCHYPRYPHLPGLGVPGQWRRVLAAAAGSLDRVRAAGEIDAVMGIYLYPYGVAAAHLARRLDKPLILSARGTDGNVLAGRWRLRRRVAAALESAHMLHAVSAELAGRMRELAGSGPMPILVEPNGVDTARFRPGSGGPIRQTLGLPPQCQFILSVGRLDPVKNQGLLVAALAHLPANLSLVLAGDGPLRARLARQAARLGVADRLWLVGPRTPSELADLYREAKLFVLPSLREGCPNALLEALASGLPALASGVGAVPQVLADRRLGSILRTSSPARTARVIQEVLAQPRSDRATARFREKWCWPQVAGRIAAAMEGILP